MAHGFETVLTAREVSFVTDIDYDQVTRAFETGRVASVATQPRRRRLDLRRAFEIAVAERLKRYPAPVKERLQRAVGKLVEGARSLAEIHDVDCADRLVATTFKAGELARMIQERLATLDRLRDLIATDQSLQAGAPVFKGTRIMVRHIAGMIRNGVDRQELAEDFPELTDEMIELAVLYDRLSPPKGRPAQSARGA